MAREEVRSKIYDLGFRNKKMLHVACYRLQEYMAKWLYGYIVGWLKQKQE